MSCIYCEACFDLCQPEGYCPRGGREGGCSTEFVECSACAYSSCSWDFGAMTGVCITQYQACDASSQCLDLWGCLDEC
jgi:hypothetical protein